MESSLSSGLKIKRTCDGCTASKVKCSGTLPCTRCSSRGIDCFYRARKKREAKTAKGNGEVEHVKKTRDISDDKSTTSTTTSATSNHHGSQAQVLDDLSNKSSVLLPHEKRSWIVFFSLYKNYNAACARFWFERQLARIKLRLEKAQQRHMLSILKEWASRMDVDYERVNDRGERCIKAMANPNFKGHAIHDCGGIHLHVDGKLANCQGNAQRVFSLNDPARLRMDDVFKASPSTPILNLKSSGTYPEDIAVITVNPAFEYLFGISQAEINARTRVMGSGLLPWGGDLLCMLAESEADVFAFMQICAINLNWTFLGRKTEEFPLVREVPSAQVIPVRTPHSEKGIPCLMKCVHRDLVDLKTGITMEVEMSFEPLVPLTQLPSVSSPPAGIRATSSNTMFEQCGLPLADASEGSAPTPDQVLEDDPFPPEAFFPDVGLMNEDETFLDELLTFARAE